MFMCEESTNNIYQQPERKRKDIAGLILSIVSLVCGIFSLGLFWYPIVGLVLGITAIITGAIAKKRVNSGMSRAGLTMGIIGTILGFLALIAWIVILILGASGAIDTSMFDMASF